LLITIENFPIHFLLSSIIVAHPIHSILLKCRSFRFYWRSSLDRIIRSRSICFCQFYFFQPLLHERSALAHALVGKGKILESPEGRMRKGKFVSRLESLSNSVLGES
ncbi:hypothetical protein PENTCL1PPCAC_12969, partial [Pristionchus entomophagus]